jgi:hypothetical protein
MDKTSTFVYFMQGIHKNKFECLSGAEQVTLKVLKVLKMASSMLFSECVNAVTPCF